MLYLALTIWLVWSAGILNVLSGGVVNTKEVDLGNQGAAIVLIDGGTINAVKTFKVGNAGLDKKGLLAYSGAAGAATINHGGTVDVGGLFFVGANATAGTLTLNDGTVTALSLTLGDAVHATAAKVDLLEGSITLTSGKLTIRAADGGSDVLNMENDVQMIVSGNQLNDIDTYVNANRITFGNGSSTLGVGDKQWRIGNSYLNASYDGTNTTVWVPAIPNPAAGGMPVLSVLIICRVRR